MRIYKILQTGPNIQFGGLKNGFSSKIYQSLIEELVAYQAIAQIIMGTKIDIINFVILFIIYFWKNNKLILIFLLKIFLREKIIILSIYNLIINHYLWKELLNL